MSDPFVQISIIYPRVVLYVCGLTICGGKTILRKSVLSSLLLLLWWFECEKLAFNS